MLNDLIALRILCIPRMYFCAYGRISSSVVLVALLMGFSGGSAGKESACNVGDLGSIPGLGRSPEGGHGNPLQYSCLENPHGQRTLVGYIVHGVTKSRT